MSSPQDSELVELRRQLEKIQKRLGQADGETSNPRNSRSNPPSDPAGDVSPGMMDDGNILFDGFEVFTGRRVRASSLVPRAAFQRRGNLSLNRASYQALGEPEAVIYAYNAAAREIAIKAAPKSLTYAMPVRQQKNSQSYLVAAGSFMNSIGLELQSSVLAFDSVEVRDGVLILALDRARKVATHRVGRTAKDGQGGP